MPPKANGKATATANGDETNPIDVDELETAAGPNGIAAFELPKSKVLKIAKASLPANVKLQKEIAPALTRGGTVFISYLATLAHESAQARGVKTITADDVLNSLEELDWGEGPTNAMRKDMKKQLKAFRAIAKAKKAGTLPPTAPAEKAKSMLKGKGRASDVEEAEADQADADMAVSEPELLGALSEGDFDAADSDGEDDGNVTRLVDDTDGAEDLQLGDDEIEDDEDEEEDEQEEEEDDDDIEEEEPENPDDFDDEMGKGLDGKRGSKNGDGEAMVAEDV